MPAALIKGGSASFGIATSVATMVATNLSANASSNKVEAKNIQGGTAAVAFTGKKTEFNLEGYATGANSVTPGGEFTPTNLVGFGDASGSYVVEEITGTKTSEDFARIKYKVVQRDGIS